MNTQKIQRKKELYANMENIPLDNDLYWKEFIDSQDDYLTLFKFLHCYTMPRKNVQGRKCLLLYGRPGVGKTWCLNTYPLKAEQVISLWVNMG